MLYFIILHLLASILLYAPVVGDGVTAYTPLLSNYRPIHTIQVNRPVDYDVKVGAEKIIDAIATSSFESLDLTAFGKDTNQAIIAFPLVGVHVTAPARSVESEIRALYASFDMSLIRGAGAKAYVRHVPAVNATATVDIAPVPAHLIHHSILSVGQAFGPVAAAAFKANATSVTVNVQVAARQSSLKKASAPIETVTGSVAHIGKPFVRTITSFLPVGQSFGPVSFTSFHANVSHYTVDTAPVQPTIETPLKSGTIHQWVVCGTNINELEVCLVDPLSVRELSVIDDGASNTERVGYNVRWTVAFVIAFGVLVQVIDAVLFQHSLPLIATTSNCTTVVVSSVQPVELPESTCVPIQLVAEETILEFTPSSPAVSTDATTSDGTEAETTIGSDVEASLPLAAETAESSLPPPSTTSVTELSTVATTKRDPATACAPYVKSVQDLPKEVKEVQKPSIVKQGASATRRARRAAQGSSDRRIFLIHATDSFDLPIITVVVPSTQWADRLTRLQQSHFVESAFQLLALADSTSELIQPAADKEVVSELALSLLEPSTDGTASDQALVPIIIITEASETTISADVEINLPLPAEADVEPTSTEDIAPASAIHTAALDVSSAPVPSISDRPSGAINEVPEAVINSDVEIDLPLVAETVDEPTSTDEVVSEPAPSLPELSTDATASDQALVPIIIITEASETTVSANVEIDLPLTAKAVVEPTSTEDVAPASAIHTAALDVSSAPVASTSGESSDPVNEVSEATSSEDVEDDLSLVAETVSELTSTKDVTLASAIDPPALDVSFAPVPSTSDQSSDVVNEVLEAVINSAVEINLPLAAETVVEPTSANDVVPASTVHPPNFDVVPAPVPSASSTVPAGRSRPVIVPGARNLLRQTVKAAQSSNNRQQTTGPRPRAELKIKGAAAKLASAPKAPRRSFFHTIMDDVLTQDKPKRPSRQDGPSRGPSAPA